MSSTEVIRLLIINDSASEAERLISMLENAGKVLRPQHADSESALEKLLQEQNWDLLIAQQEAKSPSVKTAVTQINKLGKDIPVIIQSDTNDSQLIIEGIKLGAKDVVILDNDQHLLLVLQRELSNRRSRVEFRQMQQMLTEIQRRNSQLLDHSKDAIAYIQDGMFIYTNQSFAELMGQSLDDLDCMPVIDMVAESDHSRVRSFLKDFILKKNEHENSELTFNISNDSGEEKSLTVAVGHATYDDEPCLQFYLESTHVDPEAIEEALQKVKDRDPATGSYTQAYTLEQLDKLIKQTGQSETLSSVTYFRVDNIEKSVIEEAGMSAAEETLRQLTELLTENYGEKTIGRFGDFGLVVLEPDVTMEQPEARARKVAQQVSEHIFTAGDITLNITVSAGISFVGEQTGNAEQLINLSQEAAKNLAKAGGNGVKLYEPENPDAEHRTRSLHHSIQKALDQNRFKLLYQPIINLRGNDEEIYEVLLRLIDDTNTEIPASEFIGTAKDIAAIGKIDRWVILEAIKILGKHREEGHQTRLVINISGQSICDDNMVPWLKVAFKAANLDPAAITFQVQEIDVNRHLNSANQFSKQLKVLGSDLAISNFGRSIDPYKCLNHVDCRMIKVDGSFAQDIQHNGQSVEQIKSIIQKLLGMDKVTIVPFVESATTLSMLWQTGVHYIQGHYLQAPSDSMNYDFYATG